MKKLVIFLAIILGIVLVLFISIRTSEKETDLSYEKTEVYFGCDEGKEFAVTYFNSEEQQGYAEIVFNDGKSMVYQTISASGARYLSEDESIELWTKGDEIFIKENGEEIFTNCKIIEESDEEDVVGLPNPASVYCVDEGGTLEIREDVDGNQTGFCIFDDGSECEEWKLFNGECKKGDFFCKDMCGDGVCQEIVCMAVGCPCAENAESCPQDCFK